MNTVFHEGEFHIQETMGVRKDSDALASMIRDTLPFIAKGFLQNLKFCVLTLLINENELYSIVVYDEINFIDIRNDSSLIIDLNKKSYLPLSFSNKNDLKIGLLGIDFEQAMRIRINGKAKILNNKIIVSIQEAYANCPKYIKKRIYKQSEKKLLIQHIIKSQKITKEFSHVISNTETFFLSTYHDKKGADISHKGGDKGFIKVVSPTAIQFIDMPGNNLFNSLGNIYTNTLVNLLFIDFVKKDTYLFIGNASLKLIFENKRKAFEVTINCISLIKNTNSFNMNYI